MLKEHAAPQSLQEAILYFENPDTALAFVVQLRWPSGVSCPTCGTANPYFLRSRRMWKCRSTACSKRQFSVKVGTIFEDSALGLNKWLPALWMLANAKNGISSYELGRALKVTQKTAWFMLSRVRLAMQSKSFRKMKGRVEIDEAFIGGKAEFMHKGKRNKGVRRHGQWDKAAVLGMLERKRRGKHSTVVLHHVAGIKERDLMPHVDEHVEKGSEVFTDALRSYRTLTEKDYKHAAIDHAVAYAKGHIHTNGLENFWSLLKRSIKGTYISVDPFHLFRYLDEQAFRFNKRTENDLGRFVQVLRRVVGRRLTYAELISADMVPATTGG